MTEPRLRDYLEHIAAAIERIRQYTGALDRTAFEADELVQDGVIRNIEIIGEASHRIQTRFPEFAAEHPELPIAQAYQMRNAVAHGYFAVDLDIVWATVGRDLPDLAEKITGLLRSEI